MPKELPQYAARVFWNSPGKAVIVGNPKDMLKSVEEFLRIGEKQTGTKRIVLIQIEPVLQLKSKSQPKPRGKNKPGRYPAM